MTRAEMLSAISVVCAHLDSPWNRIVTDLESTETTASFNVDLRGFGGDVYVISVEKITTEAQKS